MMTKSIGILSAAGLCLAISTQTAVAGCQKVAGTIDANVIGGEPANVLGNVSGGLAGATRAVLTSQAENGDGTLQLKLSHDFVTHERGTLKTTDTAVWTPVPGKEGIFHMATDYSIDGGTGAWAGASGKLKNEGIADTNTGLVTLAYSGEVCSD